MPQDSTLEDYRKRITRVVEYIYDHLDDDLNTQVLSKVACFSEYHWHRIYHGMTGETAAQTIRRLRLHRAAGDLLNSELTITEIATRACYGSVEAFNRAFREAYHLPPAKFRKQGETLFFKTDFVDGDDVMYDVEMRDFQAVTLAAIGHKGPYIEVGQAFEKLFVWAGARGLLGPNMRTLGIYYDDPNEVAQEDLRSAAGIAVPNGFEADDTVHITKIPDLKCAVLPHKGPYAELHKAYHWFFGTWLPESGHETANFPPFEDYLNDPKTTAPSDLLTDIYMPLK